MLTVKLKNLTLEFCLGFFLAAGVIALDSEKAFLRAIIFCFLHEIGHIIAMIFFGVEINGIKFYSGGIKILTNDLELCSKTERFVIYSAGCAVNLLLILIMTLLSDYKSALLNFVLAVFNLMPIAHFDGGMIFKLFVNNSAIEKVVSIIAYAVQSVFALVMLMFSFSTEDYTGIVMYVLMLLCSVFE